MVLISTSKLFAILALLWFVWGQPQQPVVYLIGDSTMADKPYSPANAEKGWGQVLPLYFGAGLTFENHAVNGRSSKSFITEGRWEKVRSQLNTGDFVVIQFGHNDQKIKDSTRYTDPDGAYRQNLKRFVRETREAGANPVLATSIVRRKFDENGRLADTHGAYPDAVRDVAATHEVPLLDMEEGTRALVESWGPERSKLLYLHLNVGEYPGYPEGREDNTHLSAVGAFRVSDLAVTQIREVLPELAVFLKD